MFFNFYIQSNRQAVIADRTVYISGCLGLNKDTGKLVNGGVGPEARLALENLKAVLLASGSDVNNVVKTTIFVQNLDDFATVNEEYQKGMFNCGFSLRSN